MTFLFASLASNKTVIRDMILHTSRSLIGNSHKVPTYMLKKRRFERVKGKSRIVLPWDFASSVKKKAQNRPLECRPQFLSKLVTLHALTAKVPNTNKARVESC